MDLYNDIFKYNNVFIKYMDNVKLNDDEFIVLRKYRAYNKLLRDCQSSDMFKLIGAESIKLMVSKITGIDMMKVHDLYVKYQDEPILFELKMNVINNYLKGLGD